MALPIWVVSSTMRLSAKTVQVILVFSVGTVAVITGIIRLIVMIRTDFSVDTTYKVS